MMPTRPLSTTDSPVVSSAEPLPRPGGVCAIHQPNFLPRLGTLAKIFAADYWIVLDDVQFARRDYQHRARIAPHNHSDQHQWLSLATHLPDGRGTLIRDARLIDPLRSRDQTTRAVRHCYRRSRRWDQVSEVLDRVLPAFAGTDRTCLVAEATTRALLDLLGWKGQVIRSSQLPARRERSQRLADLAAVTGATAYLCGPGGLRYLNHEPFEAVGVPVEPFTAPSDSLSRNGRQLSGLHALSTLGVTELVGILQQPELRSAMGVPQ